MRGGRRRLYYRVRYRLLNVATALSLALCVAAGALWGRSYRWSDQVLWWSHAAVVAVYHDHGRVYLAAAWPSPQARRGLERVTRDVAGKLGAWERDAHRFNHSVSVLGFGYGNADGVESVAARLRVVCVPHWFLCIALPALAAGRFGRALRRRRLARAGRCARCGYDVRATPDRCPECGRAAAVIERSAGQERLS